MGNLASGHFKPTNNIQEQHNDRTLSPSYLIPQEFRGQNEVNRPSTQARGLRDKIIENAHQTYLITFKQKSQAKSYQWSLVVNIKTNTTMSDLEKLAEHFEIKYGFQCYQIAIHRDEGYMDENNQPHINHHAHMEFITLNKENGKNMWGQINKVKLRQIQTEIAQILGMERGTDKRVSGIERIEPRKYAQMKNKERKELQAKDKELNTLKHEKTTLTNQLQEQATETKKAQDRIKTLESDLNAKNKEIATALDTANDGFQEKATTLQGAVRRIHGQAEMLSAIYHFLHQTSPNYVSKITEKHKHEVAFTKTFDIIKKLKELYSKIVEKLFGDKNAKKDHQDILNAISELQERPTKQQLEAKEKEISTLKQEKTTLTNQLQEQATETKKAQE
ncbi:mobilization protein [Helicobacter pylori]